MYTKEMAKGYYLIRSSEKDFHRNIVLRSFEDDSGNKINMIFDPGTKLDLGNLLPFLKEKIGGIENINIIFLSHQDPDLTANVSMILSSAPKAFVITSVDTWRLVKMYGLPENRVRTVESFNSNTIRIKNSSHRIKFIPAPFCHFRGAMMAYDLVSGILFTGDFMGGVNSRKGDDIWATEDSWEGIELFHQLYMPSRKAVKRAAETISMLNPSPQIIAPQHGDIIKGDLILNFLGRMMKLEVGMDLMDKKDSQAENVILAINNFISYLKEEQPPVYDRVISEFQKSNKFTSPFSFFSGSVTEIKISPEASLRQIWYLIESILEEDNLLSHLKNVFLDSLSQLNIEHPFGQKECSGCPEDIVGSVLD